jgi:hypothetical protein
MSRDGHYLRWFDSLTNADVAIVGGKNASLGAMIRTLKGKGILDKDCEDLEKCKIYQSIG